MNADQAVVPTSLRNVLVPLDGSERCTVAIDPGVELAGALGVPVELVTVAPWPGVEVDEGRYLAEVAAAIDGPDAPSLRTDVLRHREPVHALAAAATRAPGTIVVMATHGRSGPGRVVLGSVAEGIVTSSGAPVVLFGPSVVGPPALRGGLAVIALDGSRHAESVVADVVALAVALDLRVHLVWVRESDLLGDLREPADRLDVLAAQLTSAEVPAEVVVLDGSHPAHVVAAHAFEHTAVLCAAATHGRTGLSRAALGSVAQQLVHHSPCGVLLRRPGPPDTIV